MDDFFPNLPPEDSDPRPPAGNGGGEINIRTANTNVGAMRVAVPRHLGQVMREIDEAAQVFGHRWKYSMPFKNKKTGKTELVEGPTIGCALDVARCWGNCSVEVERVEDVGDGWVLHAVFLDIEKGVRLGRPFRQRKDQNIGGMGGDRGRAEDIVFQVGASKALRNVVVNALRGIVDEAIERGQRRLTAKIEKNRPDVIKRIYERLDEHDIEPSRVERFYGSKIDDLKSHHLAQVIKMLQALQDDLIKPEEFCPEDLRPSSPDDLKERSSAEAGIDPHKGNGDSPAGPKPPLPAEDDRPEGEDHPSDEGGDFGHATANLSEGSSDDQEDGPSGKADQSPVQASADPSPTKRRGKGAGGKTLFGADS